jgi:site-specific DNA-cytosine methylase
MKVLELFSGTGSFSKVARSRGYETFTIDMNPAFNPDLCKDINEVISDEILDLFGKPDIIWDSHPCNCFSVITIPKYWKKGKPNHEKTIASLKLLAHGIDLIKSLSPKYYIIENPVGMMRKQPIIKGFPRTTIHYCSYGFPYQKPTDLWNNVFQWIPRARCKRGSPCHISAPRSSHKGIEDSKLNAEIRGTIPPQLCIEILEAIEKINPNQNYL